MPDGYKVRYRIREDSDLEELIDLVASSIGSLQNPLKLQNTFKSIRDSFLKIITAYQTPTHQMENGVLVINRIDFLTDLNSLPLLVRITIP